MRRIIPIVLAFFFISAFLNSTFAGETKFSVKPNPSSLKSKKWRIGYFEGGDYIDYKKTLLATVEGLMVLGWIEPFDFQKFSESDVKTIWNTLANEAKSRYLCFVKDAFYSAGWETDLRENVVDAITNRIKNKADIDLIMAMGTWAGQDLSKQALNTNVLVMTASDPVASGIIKSPHDSGADNLHAHIDPTLFERQIRLFYDQIKFKKIGVIFEDSVSGRSYAGVDSIESLSKELDFEIVPCFAVSDISDAEKREKAYLSCIDKIAANIDALYVTLHGGVSNESIPLVVERSKYHRLPTFSQSGSHEVEMGLLMSFSRNSFKKVGLYQAAIMANVFNGAKPGELDQVFEEPLNISLNLSTAEAIGYTPSAAVIAAADEIYQNNRIQD